MSKVELELREKLIRTDCRLTSLKLMVINLRKMKNLSAFDARYLFDAIKYANEPSKAV